MDTIVTIHMSKKGLLIPRQALGDLGAEELEAVREERTIVIRPKSEIASERLQVRQILRDAGILYEPELRSTTPVSPEERTHLAQKLGQSGPLSKVIIADREDRI